MRGDAVSLGSWDRERNYRRQRYGFTTSEDGTQSLTRAGLDGPLSGRQERRRDKKVRHAIAAARYAWGDAGVARASTRYLRSGDPRRRAYGAYLRVRESQEVQL